MSPDRCAALGGTTNESVKPRRGSDHVAMRADPLTGSRSVAHPARSREGEHAARHRDRRVPRPPPLQPYEGAWPAPQNLIQML